MKITQAQQFGLDNTHLVKVSESHRLHADCVNAFERMQDAAEQDGIDLQIVSSFRDFERQKAIWNGKFSGQRTVLDLHEKPIDISNWSDEQKCLAILTWSAVPGLSRHHWGSDMDVYDANAFRDDGAQLQLVASEYHANGPCFALHCWLTEHAAEFGFYRPYDAFHGSIGIEPWHVSYLPLAEDIADHFNCAALADLLTIHNVQGADYLHQHIEDIFERYTLNKVRL